MVRLYGKDPYDIYLLHGGPGAIGSLKGFAKELSEKSSRGVVESIQSQYTINELIEELYKQIQENSKGKVTLIGHSWGAWLAILFTEKHPELVNKIVLVGCPPLKDSYVNEITKRRFENLSDKYAEILQRVFDHKASEEDMKRIPKVLEKADNYCLEDSSEHNADSSDSNMYNAIWKEAAQLRTKGKLVTAIKTITAKIYLLQGVLDPHPFSGVVEPLNEIDVSCETYILEQCGHSPYMEKYAKDEFYRILGNII